MSWHKYNVIIILWFKFFFGLNFFKTGWNFSNWFEFFKPKECNSVNARVVRAYSRVLGKLQWLCSRPRSASYSEKNIFSRVIIILGCICFSTPFHIIIFISYSKMQQNAHFRAIKIKIFNSPQKPPDIPKEWVTPLP